MELTKHQKEKKRFLDRCEAEVRRAWMPGILIPLGNLIYRYSWVYRAFQRIRKSEGLL